jgi:chitinase
MKDETKQKRITTYAGLNFGGVSGWAVNLDKDYSSSGIGNNSDDDDSQTGGKNCPLTKECADLEALANDGDVSDDCRPVLAVSILEKMLDSSMTKYNDADNGYAKNFEAYQRVIQKNAEAAFSKFADWEFGKMRKYTDCDFQRAGGKNRYNGPCEDFMKDDPLIFHGKMTMKMTIRDGEGLYDALEAEAGTISDWIELKEFKEYKNGCSGCQGSPSCLCVYKDVTITGIPFSRRTSEFLTLRKLSRELISKLSEMTCLPASSISWQAYGMAPTAMWFKSSQCRSFSSRKQWTRWRKRKRKAERSGKRRRRISSSQSFRPSFS